MIGKAGMMSQRPAWSPSVLAPLVWLDAQTESTITKSSNVVSQWNDRGTNGNNFSNASAAGRPSYSAAALNGLPAVTSDASKILSCTLTGLSGLTNKLSVFAIAYMESTTDTGGRLLAISDLSESFEDDQSQTAAVLIRRDGSAERIDARRNSTDLSEKAITYGTPFIGGSVYDGTNQTTYVDGVAGTAVASSGNFLTGTFPTLYVLGNGNAAPSYWIGGVGEIIVVIGEVTTGDRQKVEGYLAHRWAATGNLDAGHPYKITAP